MSEFEESDQNFQITNVAQLQRWLPWLRMFRGFRIAIDYQKMLAAFFAVVLWGLVSSLLTFMLVGQNENSPSSITSRQFPVSQQIRFSNPQERIDVVRSMRSDPLTAVISRSNKVSWFYENVTQSILGLVTFHNYRWWWHAWLQLLWGLVIAAVFGGLISRMAAREFTGQGRSLIRDTKFSLKQAPIVLMAPLISLVSFALLWSINWISGFVGRIPVVGEIVLAICWGMFLLSGLILFLLLLGLILGWPLMVCSGAVEKNDTFDALSRAFSYLLNRPWYALFLTCIAFAYGSLTMLFVTFATSLTVTLSFSSVGAGLGQEISITSFNNLLVLKDLSQGYFENSFATKILGLWIGAALLIPAAYAFSFFWTSTTIGYFLLRRREDGTPLHEIELNDSQTQSRPELAVVGIPAAELRENNDKAPSDPY
ncbi:hypothetical protein OAF98_04240 [Planctomicrobium sp.]|nr:hypothetical protein [Planctomicrobium sp.]MDB4731234.1 hypothetical protein [bacterium]MBT5018114.1 hypothetical protein [Planctomicrobium sp.]MDB4439542.1 hypothetical protein [Planctomicrobium sp.]MDB4743674.1 hypothetical protein [Planctomicrobium sp.]MDB4802512.1 hypothetical protein [bacterium]